MKNIFNFFLLILSVSLLTAACGNEENRSKFCFDYLAVQLEEGDYWSIMDANGNIVVEKEYAPDNELSVPYGKGIYWVKANNKWTLYSVDSPKKPLTKEEYDDVTEFDNGRAFVSKSGEPIQMIDTDGDVIKTLDRNIKEVSMFSDGMAKFVSLKANKPVYGFLDLDGDIAIDAQYDEASFFNEGYAVVKNEQDNKNYQVIDKSGEIVGEIDAQKYDIDGVGNYDYFQEGKIAVNKKGDNQYSILVFLNTNGEEVVGPLEKTSSFNAVFVDGFAVVQSGNFEDAYIIDEQGNNIVRKSKYDRVYPLGKGEFLVEKNDKYGVIDSEDNCIVDFVYDDGLPGKLGDNYIMMNDGYAMLVGPDGEEIKNTEFKGIEKGGASGFVVFVDVEAIVDEFLKPISTKGYSTLKGKKTAKEIAPLVGAKMEKHTTYEDIMKGNSFFADDRQVSVAYYFDKPVKKEKTHIEEVNDGWFATKRVVHDGYEWNEDANLLGVHQYAVIPSFTDSEKVWSVMKNALEKKGFKCKVDEDGEYFISTDGKRLSVGCEGNQYENECSFAVTFILNKK